MERPRYLEDEGGLRLSSPPSPPARPPAQIQLNASRAVERRAEAPGGARNTPTPARVGPRCRVCKGARSKSTESSSLVQKWRREESLPLGKKGQSGRGRRAQAGSRDAGDAGAPGSGRSC